jgi:peptidylprolyl isomerase
MDGRPGTGVVARPAVAALALALVAVSGCSSGKAPAAAPSTVTSSAPSTAPVQVGFHGVVLDHAADLTAKPKVIARSATAPAALLVKDVVTGTGAAATPTSTVTVQYVGVRYADGRQFDASWDHGGAVSFPLRQALPAGFRQGIDGAPGTQPMKVGGRRILILPAALGYGRTGTPDRSVPPNAPLVFVVDLVAVK